MKRKILIDCDPGIDDALALLFLAGQKQLDVAAVTTSFGSGSGKDTFENGKRILSLLGMNVETAGGAEEPVIGSSRNLKISCGLCSPGWRAPDSQAYETAAEEEEPKTPVRHGWDLIYETAVREKGNLEIITLGPLTNLAVALLKYEDLKDRIKSLTVMGGSAGVGDVAPFGEANVLFDPYAFQVVLGSGIGNIVMVGLDVSYNLNLSDKDFLEIFSRGGRPAGWLSPLLKEGGERKRAVYAAAAAAAGVFPELAVTKPYFVAVELGENGQYGRTVIDARLHATAEKNVNVVQNLNREKFVEYLKKAWNDCH